ncbi:heterotrimeric GTP-binding alpha subunit [Cylindrobasidium torrendii FP15055 ss-10]|uniref:Heterotrimeric GTP-binding alpha subunit n=1 Tax=Cylindrobasidium torrendii FP15055 ss-10 TaxID=1314674 RepID=A0A0D7BCX8_9AGAR|nr:heterotrimeric GTP-binding alpha subunit [Cylindrobasidium torrendii FP15055 ss-10]
MAIVISSSRKGKSRSLDALENPFVGPMRPPANETSAQRSERARALQDAQARSRKIDDDLQETKRFLERRKKALKILLLGQAESGKSTVLKNFQLAYAPATVQRERVAWKRIVQLNLILSVKAILGCLQADWNAGSGPTDSEADKRLRALSMRLKPLIAVIRDSKVLCDEQRGLSVPAGGAWKQLFTTTRDRFSTDSELFNRMNLERNDPGGLLHASKEDIMLLWTDDVVQRTLARHSMRLEESSGFFLDDTPRIADIDYLPTDDDIVRARVRTVGVEEHHIIAENGKDKGAEFFITDVGGSRSSRASWVPYFDDVNAILFLAPLSFNQMLEEDPTTNRLEDSLSIWRDLCGSKLLAHCTLILLLNKKDILARALASGVEVKKYVTSYNEENTVPNVTKYFRDRFKHYHRKLSPTGASRPFIVYETSAIDTRTMKSLVVTVHDSIIRKNLANSDII